MLTRGLFQTGGEYPLYSDIFGLKDGDNRTGAEIIEDIKNKLTQGEDIDEPDGTGQLHNGR